MKHNGTLPEQVQAFLQEEQMVQAGDTICCALSGGADSVCLLRCLLELSESLHLTLTAVHVNHQLRGAESERDAAFCEALCAKWKIPLHMVRCDVTAYAEQHHTSIETAARICRYAAFSAIPANHIATAHTASDNLETMLHRLIRGSGLRGLAGIPAVRERYIRPLLTVTRTEVEAYLQTLGQDYVTDSTNETDVYTRNQIRHQLIPVLQQLNPSLEQTSVGMLQVLRSEQDYLRQQTAACFQRHFMAPGTLSGLLEEHPAMQQRCLIQLLEQFGIAYQADKIHRLQQLLQTGGKCNLNADYDAVAKDGSLSVQKRVMPSESVEPKILHEGENQIFSGFFVKVRTVSRENLRNPLIVHKKLSKILLDYDKIRGVILLRGRQYGDHVQFAGHRTVVSVKKQIQKQVPPERRQNLHFLADEMGTIFAEFLGVAARVAPTAETTHFLELEVIQEQTDLESLPGSSDLLRKTENGETSLKEWSE